MAHNNYQKSLHQNKSNPSPFNSYPSSQNLPDFASFTSHESSKTLSYNNASNLQLPQLEIQPFQEIIKIERLTKDMVEGFYEVIDEVLATDRQLDDEQVLEIVNKLKNRHEMLMKMIEGLPLYQEASLESYEKNILWQHQEAVRRFKKALESAAQWKKQIHFVIDTQLFNKF